VRFASRNIGYPCFHVLCQEQVHEYPDCYGASLRVPFAYSTLTSGESSSDAEDTAGSGESASASGYASPQRDEQCSTEFSSDVPRSDDLWEAILGLENGMRPQLEKGCPSLSCQCSLTLRRLPDCPPGFFFLLQLLRLGATPLYPCPTRQRGCRRLLVSSHPSPTPRLRPLIRLLTPYRLATPLSEMWGRARFGLAACPNATWFGLAASCSPHLRDQPWRRRRDGH
jgi:hypothetical protein